MSPASSSLHDAYAVDYDDQIRAYDCHLADVLFSLCYEYTQPGQTLVDIGIGSGISAILFAKAGLNIYGMDFSPAMLEICQGKGIAVELKQHDLGQTPWPYSADKFDHLVCCGVLHFIPDLESIFDEVERVLISGGMFAFTTKTPSPAPNELKYEKQLAGDFEIFSHLLEYVQSLLDERSFQRMKTQKYFVGEDMFNLWVVQKNNQRKSA